MGWLGSGTDSRIPGFYLSWAGPLIFLFPFMYLGEGGNPQSCLTDHLVSEGDGSGLVKVLRKRACVLYLEVK